MIIGGYIKSDKSIQIEGILDSEVTKILNKLRKKARIQNYQ